MNRNIEIFNQEKHFKMSPPIVGHFRSDPNVLFLYMYTSMA